MFVHAELLSWRCAGPVFNSDTKWHQQKQQLHQTENRSFSSWLLEESDSCRSNKPQYSHVIWMSVWETCQGWHWTPSESSRCFLELWIRGMMRSDHTCTCLVVKPVHFSYTADLAVSKKLSIHKPQVCVLFHPLHIVLCCLQHLSPSLHFSVNEMKQPSGILQIANHHRNDCYDHLIWLTVIQGCRQFGNYHSHFTDEKTKAQRDGKKKKKPRHHSWRAAKGGLVLIFRISHMFVSSLPRLRWLWLSVCVLVVIKKDFEAGEFLFHRKKGDSGKVTASSYWAISSCQVLC